MSVVKLLSRIVAPDVLDNMVMEGGSNEVDEQKVASTLHDHTYGKSLYPTTFRFFPFRGTTLTHSTPLLLC